MKSIKYTTLTVSRQVYERLKQLKEQYGYRSYDQLIEELLATLALMRSVKIASVLCLKYAEAKATPAAWSRIFQQEKLPSDAFQFLKPVSDTELAVDREKCRSVLGAVAGEQK